VNLFYHPNIQESPFDLDLDESRHVKAMRTQDGQQIMVTDGLGHGVIAAIQWKKHIVQCHFVQSIESPHLTEQLTLVMAPTKQHERMEWLVEKAVEIGVAGIHFVHSNNSERPVVRMDRIQRVAIAAMKQSQRFTIPKLQDTTKFSELLRQWPDAQHLLAHCREDMPRIALTDTLTPQACVLWIGPEGDFDRSEIEMAQQLGFQSISLGKARLRTETAALAALSVLRLTSHY
jgi:16S rRNA (uracil1498-N3)-methyltransferase